MLLLCYNVFIEKLSSACKVSHNYHFCQMMEWSSQMKYSEASDCSDQSESQLNKFHLIEYTCNSNNQYWSSVGPGWLKCEGATVHLNDFAQSMSILLFFSQ